MILIYQSNSNNIAVYVFEDKLQDAQNLGIVILFDNVVLLLLLMTYFLLTSNS